MRADLEQQMQSHVRTLDQLPTAVAIFDRARRLNLQQRRLRQAVAARSRFLEHGRPTARSSTGCAPSSACPSEADYRAWKERLFEAYRSLEPVTSPWYLPDGRTIASSRTPIRNGGVTYLFDDVTKAYDLETRFNALTACRARRWRRCTKASRCSAPTGG